MPPKLQDCSLLNGTNANVIGTVSIDQEAFRGKIEVLGYDINDQGKTQCSCAAA